MQLDRDRFQFLQEGRQLDFALGQFVGLGFYPPPRLNQRFIAFGQDTDALGGKGICQPELAQRLFPLMARSLKIVARFSRLMLGRLKPLPSSLFVVIHRQQCFAFGEFMLGLSHLLVNAGIILGNGREQIGFLRFRLANLRNQCLQLRLAVVDISLGTSLHGFPPHVGRDQDDNPQDGHQDARVLGVVGLERDRSSGRG